MQQFGSCMSSPLKVHMIVFSSAYELAERDDAQLQWRISSRTGKLDDTESVNPWKSLRQYGPLLSWLMDSACHGGLIDVAEFSIWGQIRTFTVCTVPDDSVSSTLQSSS